MILVLGGTHEGRAVAEVLMQMKLPFILTVTSTLGVQTYADIGCEIAIAAFSEMGLISWIQDKHIKLVVDATHPHALEIKKTAKNACDKTHIPYLRYTRGSVSIASQDIDSKVRFYSSMNAVIDALKNETDAKMNLLITGTKHISDFYKAFPKEKCFFRVMPSLFSMKQCEENGVPTSHIIGIKAPCPVVLNQALFEAYQITHFVFKDSGMGSAYLNNIGSLSGTNVMGVIVETSADDGLAENQCVDNEKALRLSLIKYSFMGGFYD